MKTVNRIQLIILGLIMIGLEATKKSYGLDGKPIDIALTILFYLLGAMFIAKAIKPGIFGKKDPGENTQKIGKVVKMMSMAYITIWMVGFAVILIFGVLFLYLTKN